jgi:hypothetical protein
MSQDRRTCDEAALRASGKRARVVGQLQDYRSNSIGDSGVEQQIKALFKAGRSSGSGA